MSQRSPLLAFGSKSIFGALAGLSLLASCSDYLSGQDPEPPGPLVVTRMTLTDPFGNNASATPVFTDTSQPLDCMDPKSQNLTLCVNQPYTDMFSLKNSPPTPDSATKLQVVFNKVPLKVNGQDIEVMPAGGLPSSVADLQLIQPDIIRLVCTANNCGVPQSFNSLRVGGTAFSTDPRFFDYGPSLQMEVRPSYDSVPGADIPDDPLRALEPGSVYHVVLHPNLSGRNSADTVLFNDATDVLLAFETAPFQIIRLGIGSGLDMPLGGNCIRGHGTENDPYLANAADESSGSCEYTDLSNDGVIVVYFNAGVDHTQFVPTTATAKVVVDQDPEQTVAVNLSNMIAADETDTTTCDRGNQRAVYIAPKNGAWVQNLQATSTAVVKVTLQGSQIHDVSQLPGHPAGMGRSSLPINVTLQGTIQGSQALGNGASAAAVNVCL